MSLRDLLALYLLVGVACAIAVLRRAPARGTSAVFSALATVTLWPLWAPFALASSPSRKRPPPDAGVDSRSGTALARIEKALAEAAAVVADTPMTVIFPERTATRIAAEVTLVAARLAELDALAIRSGYDRVAAARRLEELESSGAAERAIATARLQLESLERLTALRAADARALDELADLLEALCTQLAVARYAGAPSDDTAAIVSEVWARLEGLGAVLDPGPGPGPVARER